MWDFFQTKRILDLYAQSFDMINSPFAFPRLPPRANAPLGISDTGRIKDQIVNDKDTMMGRLFDHHAMFQRHALGLFNLSPGRFNPGYPMHLRVNAAETLQEENERLRRENSSFKTEQIKEKKK